MSPCFTRSRRSRTALRALAAAAAFTFGHGAIAQPAARPRAESTGLSAALFYQLLLGELELRTGEPGEAYQILLDAARRTRDEQLFRRATEIAVQARAGEQALGAARAWRQALPASLDALRYELQILIALNRVGETPDPLKALLALTPSAERSQALLALPRFFARSADRQAAAQVIAQAAQPYVDSAETQVAARVTLGRAWLAAGDGAKALDYARSAHDVDPRAEAPAVLALEMLQGQPNADAIVVAHLAAKPDSNAVRLLYVRSLLAGQRFADATTQLEAITRNEPQFSQAWLTLGAVKLQLREPAEATAALQRYVDLVQSGGETLSTAGDPRLADDDVPQTREDALTRAYLLLSQAADQQGDLRAAADWLSKIDNPQRALEVQARRASIVAREGKIAEAREMIRRLPERTPADARSKLFAEAQVLRDTKRWGEAEAVLAEANRKFPDDVDLIYEQSMMLEKLDRLDEMERLLRRVIALKADHPHAYNALGYSLAERNVRLPEARSLIQKALELSPGEPSITDSLGWVEYRLGNRAEAIRLLRDAYRSQPDAEIAAHLGEVLWVDGQTEEARKIWREARGRDATNDVLRETLARLRVDL